jgi:hypothetical protein
MVAIHDYAVDESFKVANAVGGHDGVPHHVVGRRTRSRCWCGGALAGGDDAKRHRKSGPRR